MSVGSLTWALLLLMIINYVFGLLFMQATGSYLVSHWGSVYRSMVSLFKATTGGDDWGNIGDSLQSTGEHFYIIFLVYIAVLYFAILNIVTGIFLQNADKASSRDLNNILREEQQKQ